MVLNRKLVDIITAIGVGTILTATTFISGCVTSGNENYALPERAIIEKNPERNLELQAQEETWSPLIYKLMGINADIYP